MQLVRLDGPTQVGRQSATSGDIEIAPVTEMRPGESLGAYRLEVKATKPGRQSLRVEARSARTPNGVTADTTIDVRG
jgi:hypothetical protein